MKPAVPDKYETEFIGPRITRTQYIAAQKAQYFRTHREMFRQSSRRYRNGNREAINKRARAVAAKNRSYHQARGKEYYANNLERVRQRHKRWYQHNRLAHIARGNAARKKLMKRCPSTRIARRLRCRMYDALTRNGAVKCERLRSIIGCSISELRAHLEKQFCIGMSWDNYGYRGWHIDHIRPCASFDLSDPAQQRQCFHYTNLQPLWAEDNMRKSDRPPAT